MKKTILILDDSTDLLELLKEQLYHYDDELTVISGTSGQTVVKSLQENNVDLIISDLAMPGWDGEQMAKYVKVTKEYQHIPIIMYTGYKSYKCKYANACVTKGESVEVLFKKVDTLLRKKIQYYTSCAKIKIFLTILFIQGLFMSVTPEVTANNAHNHQNRGNGNNNGNNGNHGNNGNNGNHGNGNNAGNWQNRGNGNNNGNNSNIPINIENPGNGNNGNSISIDNRTPEITIADVTNFKEVVFPHYVDIFGDINMSNLLVQQVDRWQ